MRASVRITETMQDRVTLTESVRNESSKRLSPTGPLTSPVRGESPPSDSNTNASETGNAELAPYMELIRSLARDERQAEAAIRRIREFAAESQRSTQTEDISIQTTAVTSQRVEATATTDSASTTKTTVANGETVASGQQGEVSDPLILDLDGDGIELTTLQNGTRFDLDADGSVEQTAFVTGGDAFLALDRNANGRIDNGSELFGDQNGAKDGFAELRTFDDNGDSVIDSQDSVFQRLMLFTGEANPLESLSDRGISAISLKEAQTAYEKAGNLITATSTFETRDGQSYSVANALLRTTG